MNQNVTTIKPTRIHLRKMHSIPHWLVQALTITLLWSGTTTAGPTGIANMTLTQPPSYQPKLFQSSNWDTKVPIVHDGKIINNKTASTHALTTNHGNSDAPLKTAVACPKGNTMSHLAYQTPGQPETLLTDTISNTSSYSETLNLYPLSKKEVETACHETIRGDGLSLGKDPNRIPLNLDLIDRTSFDPAAMEAKLLELYTGGKVMGFSYAINHQGTLARSGGWGLARNAADGAMAMTEHTRHHLASVSKTVNAIYYLRLQRYLNDMMGFNYVWLSRSVSPWLPGSWMQGDGFSDPYGVSFEELLSHRSGLGQMFNKMSEQDKDNWDNDWYGLKFVVANGTDLDDTGYSYKNANHALFRVLIPMLMKKAGLLPFTTVDANSSGSLYVHFLNQLVMQPIGIEPVDCTFQSSENYARFYDYHYPYMQGLNGGLSSETCGGHAGLFMSAIDLARLLAYTRYTNDLITDVERNAMIQNRLGWANTNQNLNLNWDDSTAKLMQRGLWGRFLPHKASSDPQGWITSNPRRPKAEQHTCVMQYPYQVEAVLLINSSIKQAPSPCNALKQAYAAGLVDG